MKIKKQLLLTSVVAMLLVIPNISYGASSNLHRDDDREIRIHASESKNSNEDVEELKKKEEMANDLQQLITNVKNAGFEPDGFYYDDDGNLVLQYQNLSQEIKDTVLNKTSYAEYLKFEKVKYSKQELKEAKDAIDNYIRSYEINGVSVVYKDPENKVIVITDVNQTNPEEVKERLADVIDENMVGYMNLKFTDQ
nr:hypothetical protein [Aneurinibacillus sp. XH2]